MSEGTLEIHSENILPIIKRWMYSDKDIFIRELVSNSCDAIQKLRVLSSQGKASFNEDEFRIDLVLDKDSKTLTFKDTGIGMTAPEVEKYIAQLAFSGAEEFVEKYQQDDENSQIIGHFGLGFYSSFMVSDLVEIDTLSYQEGSQAAYWRCDGSPTYTLNEGLREERGTTITLHIGEDSSEYLEEHTIKEILTKYCSFLPVPVFFNDEQINTQEPLWVKPASECSDEDYLNFYRYLYPGERDPLFWIHLNVDYPFHLQGILYFPHMKRQTEMDKHMIHLYCNRVFVSENCKEVIPEFLMGLRGIIDSPDIPLNVSRSYLQMDRTVRQLSSHIAKKVADRLTTLERTNREKFIASWTDIEVIVKLGAIQDEKFYDRVSKIIIWKNSDGEWTTVADYLERNREKTDGKIFYATGDDSQSSFIDLYKQQGIEVLHSNSLIDTYLINFLETKLENARFQRIDGAIDDAIIDSSREKTVLNADGQSQQTAIASAIKSHLSDENVEVEAKSLASDALPAFIMIDENSRRMRDYMSAADPENGKSMFAMMGKKTFVVNTNNTLVNAVETVTEKNPEVAKELVEHMYDLALLSQRELDPGKLNDFIARSNQVLEHLAGKIVES